MFGNRYNLFANIYNNRKELSESGIHRPIKQVWNNTRELIPLSSSYKDDYDRLFEISYMREEMQTENN